MQYTYSESRYIAIDYIRIIAILCVVLNHVIELTYPISCYSLINEASFQVKVIVYALFTAGRLGVPLFLMISGFLLLDRKYDYGGTVYFYKKNLLGLFITTVIWIVIYNIFISWFSLGEISIKSLLKNIFLVEQVPLPHMWYMPTIIGLYLFLPLIANALKDIQIKILNTLMMVSFVYIFIIPIINVLLNDKSYMNLPIFFSQYPFILVLGYLIKKECFKLVSNKFLVVLFITFYILTVLLQLYSFKFNNNYNVWYDCGFLIIASVSLFLLVKNNAQLNKFKTIINLWIGKIANHSFGVFLLHMLFALTFNRYMYASRPYKVVVVFVLSVVCSFSLSFIISRIKFLRKPLLFIK